MKCEVGHSGKHKGLQKKKKRKTKKELKKSACLHDRKFKNK